MTLNDDATSPRDHVSSPPDHYDDVTSSPYYSSVPDYMAENFSKAQLDEFKEAFALFDGKSSGSVPVEEIGTIVRSLGHNPSKTDVQSIQEELRKEGKSEVEFGDFLGVLAKYFKDLEVDPATELKQAFKVFDKKGDGTINVNELIHILSTLGEQLTEDEIERMLAEGNIESNGEINYDMFVKLITSNKEEMADAQQMCDDLEKQIASLKIAF
ncbi:calmodulin-like isoform X3 [Bolinopsis microptera]|uniref:calmodulin-like isoform X3 n=1 Tax=Bolinopsis microptera TaxID=2820187 RepID=UPI00307AE805